LCSLFGVSFKSGSTLNKKKALNGRIEESLWWCNRKTILGSVVS